MAREHQNIESEDGAPEGSGSCLVCCVLSGIVVGGAVVVGGGVVVIFYATGYPVAGWWAPTLLSAAMGGELGMQVVERHSERITDFFSPAHRSREEDFHDDKDIELGLTFGASIDLQIKIFTPEHSCVIEPL
ncbi:MAG: hypothetical protein V3V61_06540 [Gammaproteobacteria bacterium]